MKIAKQQVYVPHFLRLNAVGVYFKLGLVRGPGVYLTPALYSSMVFIEQGFLYIILDRHV